MIALITGLGVAVVLLLVIILRLAWRGRAAGTDAGGQARAPAENAQRANVAVLTRYEMWMRRIEREQLGARNENWADLSSTSQYAAWRRLAEARGASDDVQHYMTRSLLSEVIYAAGGVERELRQLRKALADVQQFADEATPRHSAASQEQPFSGPYVAAPSLREASYSFVNLLSWARLQWSAPIVHTVRVRQSGQDCSRPSHTVSSATAWRQRCSISGPRSVILGSLRVTPFTRAQSQAVLRLVRRSCPMAAFSRGCLICVRIRY